MGDQQVNGILPRAIQHECDGQSDNQQVVFKAFALLVAAPVHKEAMLNMTGEDHACKHGDDRKEPVTLYGLQQQRPIVVMYTE